MSGRSYDREYIWTTQNRRIFLTGWSSARFTALRHTYTPQPYIHKISSAACFHFLSIPLSAAPPAPTSPLLIQFFTIKHHMSSPVTPAPTLQKPATVLSLDRQRRKLHQDRDRLIDQEISSPFFASRICHCDSFDGIRLPHLDALPLSQYRVVLKPRDSSGGQA